MKRFKPFSLIIVLSILGLVPFLHSCSHSGNTSLDPEVGAQYDDGDDLAGTEKRDETPAAIADENVSRARTQAEIIADEASRTTFPLVYNEYVQKWIDYFTSRRGRPVMARWLARSTRVMPMMQQVLKEEGLPVDLVYLAMIESGFNPRARSHASAVGPWQFIRATGRRYDLDITYWKDERSDWVKSTYSAAKYLKELHQVFGSWYLAAAGYNAGEGRVLYAVRRDRSRNFWELARKRQNFRAETRNYVPKIIAAALISKNPTRYGFTNIDFTPPMSWESVKVPTGVTLRSISNVVGVSESELHILNAELRRYITPPGDDGYDVRVPVGKGEVLAANVGILEAKKIGNFIEHRVRSGDSLYAIARKYGTSVSALQDLNRMRGSRIHPGKVLVVPIPDRYIRSSSKRSTARSTAPINLGPTQRYLVKSGDTLSQIAELFGTTVWKIKKLNRMRHSRSLQANSYILVPKSEASIVSSDSSKQRSAASNGDQLTVSSGGNYTVRAGDTLWDIAKRHNTSVAELMKVNKMQSARSLKPGDTLTIPDKESASEEGAQRNVLQKNQYRVQSGDTLWSIAKKHGSTPEAIQRHNGIRSSQGLRAGLLIEIPKPDGEG